MIPDWNFVIIKVIASACVLWASKLYLFPYYIPGIPIRKANHWFFGYSNAIASKKGKYDSHLLTLEEVEKTGKIFQYYNLGRLRVFISDKYIAKYAIEHINGKGFYHRGNPKITDQSIFNLNTGPEWKMRRNAFRQSFSMLQLKTFQDQLKLLTSKLIVLLKKSAGSKTVVELDKVFGQVTVDVICSIAFQYDLQAMEDSETSREMHEAIRTQLELIWLGLLPFAEYFYHLPIPIVVKFRKAQQKIRSFCLRLFNHIKKLHAEGSLKKESVGYSLLEFSQMEGITESDVCSEVVTMFIAGHETTAHTLSFFVYALATHPEVQSKCHSAIDEATTAATTTEGISSTMSLLPVYVEAVLKESMRKYPVVAKGALRLVQDKEGVTIPLSVLNKFDESIQNKNSLQFTQSTTLPYDTWIQVFTYNVHNCKLNWGDRVEEFLPERFLANGHYTGETTNTNTTTTAATTTGSNPLSSPAIYGGGGVESDDLLFIPFAYGMRNCIGMNLALMEMRMILSEVLKNFSFTLADESMKDDRIAYETLRTSRPHKKLPVFVEMRK